VAHALILATQEEEIRRIKFEASPGQLADPISEKRITEEGLVEWLKV
jgi:hypothetical protein